MKLSEERLPPHDLETEALVIAAVIEVAANYAEVAARLEPRHFFAERHRRIFECVVDLTKAGREVDYLTVGAWLRDADRMSQCGGPAYLAELSFLPAVSDVAPLADRIIHLARARELIALAQKIAAEGYSITADESQQYLDEAEQKVFRLAQHEERREIAPMSAVALEAHSKMMTAEARSGSPEFPTGLVELDEMIGGLSRGRVTVVAARPGMGKTAFVTGVAENVAAQGDVVAIFSLEMPRWQLAMRMACSRVGASSYRGIHGQLEDRERPLVLRAHDEIKKLPIWIDDAPATLLQIRAKVRMVAARTGQRVAVVMVDYLQLMRAQRDRNTSRDEQLSDITAGFKSLAKEMDCAVVYLSQLNREVEKRPDKHPMLSDLRESGGIEQDADDVIFIFRPEYYLHEKTPEADRGIAELVVAKQRNGPTGTIRVGFSGTSTHFSNLGASHG